MTSPKEPPANDLPGLARLATLRLRIIAIGGIAGLVAAFVVTTVTRPAYEATAFLEFAADSDLPTAEEKLRFPSLLRQVAASDEATRELARRSRAKIRRGSRLIAVTVAHPDPATAATEANALANAFLATVAEPTSGAPAPVPVDKLPDPAAADSPESLAEAWNVQSAEFEKLSQRYANDDAHPAVAGARQRLDALGKRIQDRVAELRKSLDLPADENALDPGTQLEALRHQLSSLSRESAPVLESTMPAIIARLAEPASVPVDPVGPARPVIWLGGLVMGAFAALLWAWCCPCRKT